MAVRADVISNRRHVQRAMQAVGFVALLSLAVGAVLTASGVFAGGLGASSVKPAHAAHAPVDTDTPTSTETPTPTSTPNPCNPVWSVVSSPNPAIPSFLSGVAVVTANDVWAVGAYSSCNSCPYHTLVEHWDGTSWSVKPSPNVGTYDNSFSGVAAVSANDVWAVGRYGNDHTLVEHWDGTSWSVKPSPNVGTTENGLVGVAAVSATDVWGVGSYYNGSGPYYTLVEHWDGTSWSVVPSPSPGGGTNSLGGVAAVSANDVWAVGNVGSQTLTEHWDGTSWSVVPSPSPGGGTNANYLYKVAAVSATDVWAVGFYNNGSTERTLVEHWDGTSWSVVPSPNVGDNELLGVGAVSANDVWAVGEYWTGTFRTLIEHWDGTAWSVVPSPNVPSTYNVLGAVAAAAANDVLAVGYTSEPGNTGYQTLVEHYATLCGTPTNTPTNTLTPCPSCTNTPTNTRTSTPTSTPTITGTPPTFTPTPSATAIINGHLTWQGVSNANRPSVTGTLQLCVNGSPQTFPFTTNTSGTFSITTFLYDGTYHWWIKGGRHISSSSPLDGNGLVISGGQATQEFGTQRGGNAITDNIVNVLDFNQLKIQFGLAGVRSADFDYNRVVNGSDFSFSKGNQGMTGHALTCP